MEVLKGWKTTIAAAIVAVLGALQGMDWLVIVENPRAFGWATVGMAAAVAVLRSITDTPIFSKEPAP